MNIRPILLSVLATTIVMLQGPAVAGDVKRDSDHDVLWQAGLDGIEIEWGADGAFNRIYSGFFQPVRFPDRAGISKAQLIAEEKAKAAIVRFMNQEVSSRRLVEQVDTDLETASRTQNGESDAITKETKRKMVETLTEVTGSYASGKLRGVIILEKGYDDKKAEAWVKVGISRKTMSAAAGLSNAIATPERGAAPAATAAEHGGNLRQSSEVRKTNQKDW